VYRYLVGPSGRHRICFAGHEVDADPKVRVYFLAAEGKSDPDRAVLEAFRNNIPEIKPFSAARARYRPSDPVLDRATGRPGAMFGVGRIRWLDPDHVEVRAGAMCPMVVWCGFTVSLSYERGSWRIHGFRDEACS
jgi:hypothetical protein